MTDATGRMPALYIGHGAPPLLDDALWSRPARGLGRRPPPPEGDPDRLAPTGSPPRSCLGLRAGTPLVYDFGGFAPSATTR